jgi:hypothetical protein
MANTPNLETCLQNSLIEFAKDDSVLGVGNELINSVGRVAVSFEGVIFNPDTDSVKSGDYAGLFLDADFMPSVCDAADIEFKWENEEGFFQVSINQHTGQGVDKSKNLALKLINYYKRGSKLEDDNVSLRITGVKQAQRINTGVFISTPITIYYQAFTLVGS